MIGFGAANSSFTNPCLPSDDGVPKIAPYWDDLTTANTGFGWFSTTTGTAPSRVFTLREDAQLFNSTTEVHFEVRLHENSTKFEIVYGTLGSDGSSATAGAESGLRAKQIECNSPGVLTSGLEEKAVYNPNESAGTSVHTEDVEFDQVPLAAKITVKKTLVPTADSGRFDLLVGSTVVASAAANGGSGTATVAPGTFTVKENASSGNLANYVTTIACTKNGLADVSGTGTSIAGHGRRRRRGGLHDHEQAQGNDHAAQVALADERHRQVQPDRRDQDARLRRRKRRFRLELVRPHLVHVEGDCGERDDALQLHELDRLHEERRLRAVRERNEPDGVGLAR